MSIPVKLGVIGAVGAAGTTATYFGVFHFAMPEWRPLSKDEGVTSTYASSKYAENYQKFLVGVGTASSGSLPESNDSWWNWAFKYRYNAELAKGGFAKTKEFTRGAKGDTSDNKSLQEACESAYKATASSDVISTDPGESESSKFKEEHIWKFCTAVEFKPKTVSEFENEENAPDQKKLKGDWKDKLGATHKADLLAIYDNRNNFAWQILDEQFRKDRPQTGFFSKSSANGSSIQYRCEDAYREQQVKTDDDTKPTETDLYKWCSLKGKKVTG